MNQFRKEIAGYSIEDIVLILEDQQDLYTPDEIDILKKELEDKKKQAAKEKEARRIANEQQAREAFIHRQNQIANHMLTTGYNFEGYCIKKYLHIVSGEYVMGTGILSEIDASFSDLFGSQSTTFSKKLVSAKNNAISNMIEQSIIYGGNAIIGVDFDYITFSNNMIGIVANGTSVWIEKSK